MYLQLQLSYFRKAWWLNYNAPVDHTLFLPAGQTFDSTRGGETKDDKKNRANKSFETRQLTLSTVAVSGTVIHLRHYEYPPIFSP